MYKRQVLIEDEKAARERGARIYCHAAGYGMAHSNVKFGTLTGSEAGLTNAVNNALADAGMTIDDIDAVFGFANGMKAVDDVEIKGCLLYTSLHVAVDKKSNNEVYT